MPESNSTAGNCELVQTGAAVLLTVSPSECQSRLYDLHIWQTLVLFAPLQMTSDTKVLSAYGRFRRRSFVFHLPLAATGANTSRSMYLTFDSCVLPLIYMVIDISLTGDS